MNKIYLLALGLGTVLVLPGLESPSVAHHAFAAEFDARKPVTVEGTITKTRFVNPHSWIYLDVKNQDGSVTNWGFEFSTPAALKARNVSREDVHVGAKVQVAGFRAKNGGAFGYAQFVTLPDGRRVQTGGAPDAPTAR